ncbi:hypothetical protein RLOC_00003308 [Lonchura striata]|uniref:Uncharacterized protein n=1 Tax=Lonchura striata TaxID=40157 RepID=A0A218UU64_9PASE|nr:hypothetical protein RLOC_00003308 [Lonchura striata domestica]
MGKLESLKELPTCICLSFFSSGEERKNSRHVILISQVCRDLQSGLTHLCEGGRLYMQIQIPDAFPLTLPFCSGRVRKNCRLPKGEDNHFICKRIFIYGASLVT